MSAPSLNETSPKNIRHDSTARIRLHASSCGTELHWTAGRCLRLLRPLSSKILLLSKHKETVDFRRSTSGASLKESQHARQQSSMTSNGSTWRRSAQDSWRDEEEWDSNPRPNKRIRCKYGRLKILKSSPLDQARPGSLMDSTCPSKVAERRESITKELVHTHAGLDSAAEHSQAKDAAKPKPFAFKSEPIWSKHPRSDTSGGESLERWKLCKGVADSLSALLKATDGGKAQDHGAASLYSACLRNVPRTMLAREKQLMDEDPDNDSDFISEFYAELEENAISDNWKPFGQIARAHGIQLIKRAIEHGSLTVSMASALAKLALRLGACSEATSIMDSVVEVELTSKSSKLCNANGQDEEHLLEVLKDYIRAVDADSATFRLLSKMYRQRSIASSNLSFSGDFLSSAVNSIAREEVDQNAFNVLGAVVNASYCTSSSRSSMTLELYRRHLQSKRKRHMLRRYLGRNREANTGALREDWRSRSQADLPGLEPDSVVMPLTTVCSIMSALIMTRLLQKGSDGTDEPATGAASLDSFFSSLEIRGLSAIELGALDSELSPMVTSELNLAVIFLAVFVVRAMSRVTTGEREDSSLIVLAALALSEDDLLRLGEFLLHVGKLCEQTECCEAFYLVKTVVMAMCYITKQPTGNHQVRQILQKLAVTSAFTFSEDSNQPLHLEWALSVEEELFGSVRGIAMQMPFQTPSRTENRKQANYRWEEGISEWTSKTPGALQREGDAVIDASGEVDELTDADLSPPRAKKAKIGQEKMLMDHPRTSSGHSSKAAGSERPDIIALKVVRLPEKQAAPSPKKQFDTAQDTSGTRTRQGDQHALDRMRFQDDLDELGAAWHVQSPTRVALGSTKMVQGRRLPKDRQANMSHAAHLMARRNGHRIERKLLSLVDGSASDSDFEDELSF